MINELEVQSNIDSDNLDDEQVDNDQAREMQVLGAGVGSVIGIGGAALGMGVFRPDLLEAEIFREVQVNTYLNRYTKREITDEGWDVITTALVAGAVGAYAVREVFKRFYPIRSREEVDSRTETIETPASEQLRIA